MQETHPLTFFDLNSFTHKRLFNGIEHVWQALDNIPAYLDTIPLGKIESAIAPGVTLIDSHLISIGQGCIIEPGAYIQGPCVIGAGSTIRHGAYIRGYVIAEERCMVGHASEIKGSILFAGAAAPHFNYVGDSILGASTNLGAGAVCANVRFDRKEVKVTIGDKVFDTGRKKLGLILGDRAQLGCHVVAGPGTLMGKEAICFPGVHLGGYIAAKEVVRQSPFTLEK